MVPIHWKIEVYEKSDNWPKTHIEFPDVSDSDFLVTGSAGYYGITQLNERLAYVTGPAWNTADGAMEGTIAAQQQMNAILEIVQGREPERYEQ